MQPRLKLLLPRLNEFGYCHLAKQTIDDYKIDVHEIAKLLECDLIDGMLCVSFHRGKPLTALEFGNAPDDKTMKRMIKEAKGKVIK